MAGMTRPRQGTKQTWPAWAASPGRLTWGTKVDGVVYYKVVGSGNYVVTNLNQEVAITGNAAIYVSGNIDSQLLYVGTNATVRIYCGGANAVFNAVAAPSAASLMYFGLPS